jgi:hypothetical protein
MPVAGAPAGPSTLAVLRRCGAVLVRADVEQALEVAGLQPNPSAAEAAVLRDAFLVMRSGPRASTSADSADAAEAWRADLVAAVRTRSTLEAFRQRTDGPIDSRDRLDALIEAFAAAGTEVRAALLDWMLALQPPDSPSWTVAEARLAPKETQRIPSDTDLDQPRSGAQRERLMAMLGSSDRERRDVAARALVQWPEPDLGIAVLEPYLRGGIDASFGRHLGRAIRTLSLAELRADGVLPERVLLAASQASAEHVDLLIPLALEWWEQGSSKLRQNAEDFLRRVDPDLLAESLASRWEADEWGFAQLLAGRSLLRTPALTALDERLRLEGRITLADSIRLVDGPLRGPGAKQDDAAALARLRDASQVPKASEQPSREELIDLARSGSPEQIRRALLRLVETEIAGKTNPDIEGLLVDLLGHAKPRIRLQAHRTARQLLDRPAYLRHTTMLLADPHPDVLRTAIRSVSHAGWEPAVPALVTLLDHPAANVRDEASAGLVRMGRAAVGALRRAADHARPDKRGGYVAVLELIAAG